jgi:MoxR-like ATPase
LLNGRGHVLPEDLKAVLPAVVTHRLSLRSDGQSAAAVVESLLAGVPGP